MRKQHSAAQLQGLQSSARGGHNQSSTRRRESAFVVGSRPAKQQRHARHGAAAGPTPLDSADGRLFMECLLEGWLLQNSPSALPLPGTAGDCARGVGETPQPLHAVLRAPHPRLG